MQVFLGIVAAIGAFILGIFGWVQIFASARFGIPQTQKAFQLGYIDEDIKTIFISMYKKTIVLWIVIIAVVSILVFLFARTSHILNINRLLIILKKPLWLNHAVYRICEGA